jgi:hypothetical protein
MPILQHRLRAFVVSAALLLLGLHALFAANGLPAPNGLLTVTVTEPAMPNPAVVGQTVEAAFGLLFTKHAYRQEAQTQGIASQKLTLRFEGGGGQITAVTLIGFVPIKGGKELEPFGVTLRNLKPGETRTVPGRGLTVKENAEGDELVITGGPGSPVIMTVEAEGKFATLGHKDIFLHAQVRPVGAMQDAIGAAEAPEEVVKPEVVDIVALVPSTPPLNLRTEPIDNQWQGGTFKNIGKKRINFLPFKTKTAVENVKDGKPGFSDDLFKEPKALVLVKDSIKDGVLLEATTKPANTELTFEVFQDPDEQAAVGKNKPDLKITGATTAQLLTNARGSFQIVAFPKNGKIDQGKMCPLILVEVKGKEDESKANPQLLQAQFIAQNAKGDILSFKQQTDPKNWAEVLVDSGHVANGEKGSGVSFKATVELIGGGKDGRRGLGPADQNRVYLGWANNITEHTAIGRYPNKQSISVVPAANRDKAPVKAPQVLNDPTSGALYTLELPLFLDGQKPALDPLKPPFPLLDPRDKDAKAGPRDGGLDITLSTGPDDGRGKDVTALKVGERRVISALDAPRFPYLRTLTKGATLEKVEHHLGFNGRLVVWTNTEANNAQPTPKTANTAGYRTFYVVYEEVWRLDGEWDIGFANMKSTITPNADFAKKKTPPISLKGKAVQAPAAAEPFEVRPPLPLADVLSYFAKQEK